MAASSYGVVYQMDTLKVVAKVTRVEYSPRLHKTYCWVQLTNGDTRRLWLTDSELDALYPGQVYLADKEVSDD